MKSKVSIVRCNGYDSSLVLEAARKAIDLIGGISSFVKPKSRVLVKPNMLAAREPSTGIDTHPEVLRAVIRLLKEIDCTVFVGDSPAVWGKQVENVGRVYEIAGITQVVRQEGVNLVEFDKRRWRGKFPLTTWLDNCDYFVSLPKFKTHNLTILTAAIKNLFGLVTGTYKAELHKNYFYTDEFSKILVDIYQEAKPTLTLIDGITAMEGDGPASAGRLRSLNLLFAGVDCVALDSVLALIMGLKPLDILTTREAAKRGLGIADPDSIEICGEKLKDAIGKPFLLPTASKKRKLPQPVIDLAKKLIRYYPCVERDNCTACAACIQACPVKVMRMEDKQILIDYSRCIACFCCLEVCPSAAIKVKKSIFAKMIGL